RLLLPDAVRLGDLVVGVGEEGEGQVVFVGELAVGSDGVGADAEHRGAFGVDLLDAVADAAGLRGAAGGVILWVEVEDDLLSTEIGEADGVAVLVGQLEVGGRVAGCGLHARQSPPSSALGPAFASRT